MCRCNKKNANPVVVVVVVVELSEDRNNLTRWYFLKFKKNRFFFVLEHVKDAFQKFQILYQSAIVRPAERRQTPVPSHNNSST